MEGAPHGDAHANGARRTRRARLTRSAEFERAYRRGRSTANRHLVLYAFANPGTRGPRLGVSVSRKVGGAVERNRLKRLLREAFARAECALAAEHDVVLVARPPAGELAEREGLAGVQSALADLLARSGLDASAGAGGAPGGDAAEGRG